ncbi:MULTISPECIES: helix-turn-helix transcriptional regulator [unclassified Streptomyces]|nr:MULTISPECIES: helix-turn-helix transcriptional regulator [unclassified Streptomyces]TXS08820.1 XRE family transcriptional regulator [Streptomyces sp. wa22]WSQ80098.1 helix-turn-helix transcriptional regulator [Streptomyces sp. NBC_01213]WSR06560.1 helix-turn-helix transcriptional regulator [Streptomyces sp. NBC_01208]WSR50778.1 helix-turn-helix transcriptional regulator [Streptomyces sp. NBC_01201]
MRMHVPSMAPVGSAPRGSTGERRENSLGEFLRARRSQLAPADVGLSTGGRRRRVDGLRRQEVAVLAHVSADHYSRLEQGRERHPSPRIVEALAQALRLAPDARSHLFRLAGLNPNLRPDTARGQVHPELLHILETSHQAAAYVLSPGFDILAANALARVLLSPFADADAAGTDQNLLRILFTHPGARTYFTEWPVAAAGSLHTLRLNAVRLPNDTEIVDLITGLFAQSADFARNWENSAAIGLDHAYRKVVHPTAGHIELSYRVHGVAAVPGQHLLVGAPAPGSRSAEAFTYLAAMGGQQP